MVNSSRIMHPHKLSVHHCEEDYGGMVSPENSGHCGQEFESNAWYDKNKVGGDINENISL